MDGPPHARSVLRFGAAHGNEVWMFLPLLVIAKQRRATLPCCHSEPRQPPLPSAQMESRTIEAESATHGSPSSCMDSLSGGSAPKERCANAAPYALGNRHGIQDSRAPTYASATPCTEHVQWPLATRRRSKSSSIGSMEEQHRRWEAMCASTAPGSVEEPSSDDDFAEPTRCLTPTPYSSPTKAPGAPKRDSDARDYQPCQRSRRTPIAFALDPPAVPLCQPLFVLRPEQALAAGMQQL